MSQSKANINRWSFKPDVYLKTSTNPALFYETLAQETLFDDLIQSCYITFILTYVIEWQAYKMRITSFARLASESETRIVSRTNNHILHNVNRVRQTRIAYKIDLYENLNNFFQFLDNILLLISYTPWLGVNLLDLFRY